ncbi:MAG: hypothetical protein HY906_03495 [Deltaproteobacteria bacterium]|nr:hypothetical protein [Deltaproteobacteria bacterium]
MMPRRSAARSWFVVVVSAMGSVMSARPAAAWEVEDPLHQNCHERMAAAALAQAGYRGGPAPPVTHDEEVFIDNQQFDASHYDRNMYALALILGVRSNDVRGLPDFALGALAAAANDDADQPAHCLRRLADDGPMGDQQALQRCRDFIEREVTAALEGTAAGTADPLATEDVDVFVPYVGTIRWPLQRFYYHAGRALHALQDAFTHSYRDETWHRVLAVMNWSDPIRGDLDEVRDGPPHETMLDKCDTDRPWRAAQLEAVGAASQTLMQLLVDADPDARDATHVQLTTLLDDWLTSQGGCSVENAYCGNAVYADLKENGLSDGTKAGGCAAGGAASSGAPLAWLALAGLVVVGRRRWLTALLVVAVMLGAAPPAGAAPASQPASAPATAVPATAAAAAAASTAPPAPAHKCRACTREGQGRCCRPQPPPFQVVIRAGVSISDPAAFLAAGALYTWRRLEVEAALEWNPWFSVERGSTSAGSLNLYGLAAVRWPVSPSVDLRSGLGAGLAVLLFETVGTPAGNVGPYLVVRPLGVTRRFGPRVALTVDAFELAIPIPQTRGWPFSRPQYRASVGLRF